MKQDFVLSDLRRRIESGEFLPGAQLPTRMELESEYQVSTVTLQSALNRLLSDGFVRSRGSKGTFVCDRPPHLTHYGVVYPLDPARVGWRRFWTVLHDVSASFGAASGSTVHFYYDVHGSTDAEDYQRLLHDMESRRLAGLIFASPSFLLEGMPVLEGQGIPLVGIATPGAANSYPLVWPDRVSFTHRALEYLVQRGRKRIAVVTLLKRDSILQQAERMGVKLQPYWVQPMSAGDEDYVRAWAHLLMRPGQPDRPDALIIADDNLIDGTLAGLSDAGVRLPEDLEIVAHCNFSGPIESPHPFKWLGFDCRQIVSACIDSIDCRRRGESAPMSTPIQAMFDHEVMA